MAPGGGHPARMNPAHVRAFLLCGDVQPALLDAATQNADPAYAHDRAHILACLFRQPTLRRELQRLMLRAGQAHTRREREAVELGWVNLFYGLSVHHVRGPETPGQLFQTARDLAACLRAFLMPEPDPALTAPLVPLVVQPVYA